MVDPLHQKSWTDAIKNILLDNRIEEVLRHFQLLKPNVEGEALTILERLIRYYHRNQHRMYYGFNREKKLLIGSGRHSGGAIESAHREVIQPGHGGRDLNVQARDGLNLEPSK